MADWYGDWFDFVLDWEKQMAINPELPIMPSSFEDLKKVQSFASSFPLVPVDHLAFLLLPLGLFFFLSLSPLLRLLLLLLLIRRFFSSSFS